MGVVTGDIAVVPTCLSSKEQRVFRRMLVLIQYNQD